MAPLDHRASRCRAREREGAALLPPLREPAVHCVRRRDLPPVLPPPSRSAGGGVVAGVPVALLGPRSPGPSGARGPLPRDPPRSRRAVPLRAPAPVADAAPVVRPDERSLPAGPVRGSAGPALPLRIPRAGARAAVRALCPRPEGRAGAHLCVPCSRRRLRPRRSRGAPQRAPRRQGSVGAGTPAVARAAYEPDVAHVAGLGLDLDLALWPDFAHLA